MAISQVVPSLVPLLSGVTYTSAANEQNGAARAAQISRFLIIVAIFAQQAVAEAAVETARVVAVFAAQLQECL